MLRNKTSKVFFRQTALFRVYLAKSPDPCDFRKDAVSCLILFGFRSACTYKPLLYILLPVRLLRTCCWATCFHCTPWCHKTVARMSSIRGLTFLQGGGAWHPNLTKIPLIYSVSYFNVGEIGALFGGLSPPPHGDRTAMSSKRCRESLSGRTIVFKQCLPMGLRRGSGDLNPLEFWNFVVCYLRFSRNMFFS